jgi:hypothetical protein
MRLSLPRLAGPASTFALSGALVAGTLAALSHVNVVQAADRIIADVVCNSPNPCKAFANNSGDGVDGTSYSSGAGVRGSSYTGPGVAASSTYDGVDAVSTNLDGGYFYGGYDGLVGVGTTTSAFPLVAVNSQNGTFMEVDEYGNVYATGSFTGNSLRTRHSSGAGQVSTFGEQAPQSTLEDVGSARMVGGKAEVALEPGFARMIDRSDYHVFLTPRADTRGLYLAATGPRSFQVRESAGGRSSLSFDYRIVARPLDDDRSRLPGVAFTPRKLHPMRLPAPTR